MTAERGHGAEVAVLNRVLEQSRSAVSLMQSYLRATADEEVRSGLREAIVSQARICSAVYQHIRSLGGEPSAGVAPLAAGSRSLTDPTEQLEALATVLEGFVELVTLHVSSLDAFCQEFFGRALPEQRRHFAWARSLSLRRRL
jgi:hypothetical protein